ncbi:hypothetical protein AHAS_Ahas16G0207400 [Arachis hypogaea]
MEALEALQDRLKQLEKGAEHQREAEKNIQREIRRRQELEDKLLKLEADLKAKTIQPSHDDDSHKDKDPFTKEIMKAKVPKDFKAPDMTPYDGTSDPSHHLRNFRSRMYLTEASDAIRYSPSRRKKPSTPQVYQARRSEKSPQLHKKIQQSMP